MKRTMVPVFSIFLLCASLAMAKKYPLTADPSIPAARGQVDVGQDKNGNTQIELKAEHLAAPESLSPPKTIYLVWFQERGSEPVNQGALKPGKNLKAEFKTVTTMRSFDVLVTAESDPVARTPSGISVLRASVQP